MGNYNFDDLQYLQIPLPEELLKLKWHGSFTRMKRIIDAKLANDIPIALFVEYLKNIRYHMKKL